MMKVSIREFEKKDIPNKVKWINDPDNNAFLHYDIPLEIENTERWFERTKNRTDRYDAVIEVDGFPVGLIGLLAIDSKHKKAEYYVTIGERDYLGKGVANRATMLLLEYAFSVLRLNRVYLYTEVENQAAIKLYERVGFRKEGVLRNDLFSKGRFVDRYIYAVTLRDRFHIVDTPVQSLCEVGGNQLYVKRDDLMPYSFGGNKARKANLFFEQIDRGNYDFVVTYGSSSSNHCRVVANLSAARNIPCCIISPEESSESTFNSDMMDYFGAGFVRCPVTQVHDTIEKKLEMLRSQGYRPYFIPGGGHGNIGTQAYVDCYEEIRRFERENGIFFEYIFHASGTGTTQAGLICGQLIEREQRNIVGISIARACPRGRDVVMESIRDYLKEQKVVATDELINQLTVFLDGYIDNGYGAHSERVNEVIRDVMVRFGIPLDPIYSGKAFAGMLDYIERKAIAGKNILFIHTGGTPLFFDHLKRSSNKE